MPESLPLLYRRLAIQRRGFSSEHMLQLGKYHLSVNFVLPLGNSSAQDAPSEHSMVRSQYEDLRVFLHRVEGKVPDALASDDLIDLKSAESGF